MFEIKRRGISPMRVPVWVYPDGTNAPIPLPRRYDYEKRQTAKCFDCGLTLKVKYKKKQAECKCRITDWRY